MDRTPLITAFSLATALAIGAEAIPPAIDVSLGAPTGSLPKGVCVSPDGTRIYVTNYGNLNEHNITVYDAHTLARIESIDVPGIAVESAVSSDGRTLYVSNFSRNSVQFVDLATRRVLHEVRTGSHPKIVVLSPDGTRLFAANWSGDSVTEIDARTAEAMRTLPAGRNPRGTAFTRSGTLYVANFNGHTIDVYDGPSLERHHRIGPVCHIPRHLALSPDDRRLYISCFSADELAVMDTRTEQIERRIAVGHWPKAVDVSRDGRWVYTANYGGSSATVVDTTDWTANTLDIPEMDHGSGVAASPDGFGFFVTGWYDGHVYRIDRVGDGPTYAISARVEARTLRAREFHRTHPVE